MELQLFLLILVVPVVWGYPSGLVADSCSDLMPRHSGLNSQTGSAPFTVTTNQNSFALGGEVTVNLQGSTSFVGFLVEARESGGSTPVGSFVVSTSDSQLLSCNQKSNSAVSHTSSSSKKSIQVTWKPDASSNIKSIQFHATFVKNFQTFWVDLKSSVLTLTNSGPPGPGPVQTTTGSTLKTTNSISSANCGVTKVCFSQPPGCDPSLTSSCFFMSAMSSGSSALTYELTGSSNGYVAFGFSDDQQMGNDDIYICGLDSKGGVSVQHAFSTGHTAPQILPLGNISNVQASTQNGVLSCSFTSMNTISTTTKSSGINQMYYILFVYGPSSNGNIQMHTNDFSSSAKIDVSKPQLLQNEGFPKIMQAHGSLMLIAWMTTSSLGMMVARYLKRMAKGKKLCGKDIWFVVHVTVMSLTVAATAIAFILAFSHIGGWAEGAHSVLGCLVMILSLIQPTLALLRCGPQHPRRYIFNLSHAFIGVAAKGLGVAAIFTGLSKIDNTTNSWLMSVMGGFVAWEVIFYTLLELFSRWKKNRPDVSTSSRESKRVRLDSLLVAIYFLGNICFLVALLSGIGTS